ncbi:hypothetical protein [Clostridium lundense]|uniref:hypothetical protein n=1 Tax=Clostridium lundense TaxID=319475 RepID=UPI0004846AA7|nr:hypothetical protein [Clostridium lundense]
MKRRKALITAIAIFSLIFSSSQVLAEKPVPKNNKVENIIESKNKTNTDNNEIKKDDSNQSKNNSNNQNKQNGKQKSDLKHIKTLNKRLDDIEKSLTNINKEIDKYFTIQIQPDTGTNQNTSSEVNNSTTNNTTINLEEKSNTNEEAKLSEQNTSISGSQQTIEDEQTKEDEKLDEEFNDKYKEEDNGRYNSFYGKLNSLLNKLDTIRKQIEKADKNSSEFKNINERYFKLVNDVTASINRVKGLQQKQVSEIRKNYTNKKLEEKRITETKKDWEVRLSKGIKDDENNLKNISILDSKGNVVDTTIKYDELNKTITISTEDGFIKGESYTILIGGGLQSDSGGKLGKNVEKDFTVE